MRAARADEARLVVVSVRHGVALTPAISARLTGTVTTKATARATARLPAEQGTGQAGPASMASGMQPKPVC
jgi:hypothetical protein